MSSNSPTELSAVIACAAQARAASAFSPLSPYLPPPGAELHPKQAAQLDAALAEASAWQAELLRHARGVQRYLHWSYADLCDEALRIPERLRALATVDGAGEFDAARLVDVAERVFGIEVRGKGKTKQARLEARVARVLDAAYWRRTLRRRIAQETELLELKLGRVGRNGSAYCSAQAQHLRATQRQAQQRWLDETVLSAEIDGELVELPMAAVTKDARQKLSRLYAFVAAMDSLAVDGGLTVALLTATLESEWHPNPAHGKATHRWNGKTPAEASAELGARWQYVRRDLDKKGIAVSGLWAAEPHRDGCPHRHFWLLYAPEHQADVFAAFLGHFPGKLKVRRDDADGGDAMFETKAHALAGVSRPLKRKREGAQVDVSIIDRDKGSGASYVIKYVSKSIGAEGAFDGEDAKPKTKREQSNLLAIDAYRALWGMRGAQFFGIKSCLTLWDELRRAKEPPTEPELHALWRAARGGDATGRVEASQQHGDAYEYLKLRGGLAAVAQPTEPAAGDQGVTREAGLYRSRPLTQYGELGSRIEGVVLVEVPKKVKRKRGKRAPPPPPPVVLERVATRTTRWRMMPKAAQAPQPQAKRKSGKAKTALADSGQG